MLEQRNEGRAGRCFVWTRRCCGVELPSRRRDPARLLRTELLRRASASTTHVKEVNAMARPRTPTEIKEISEAEAKRQLKETYVDAAAAGKFFDQLVANRQKAL